MGPVGGTPDAVGSGVGAGLGGLVGGVLAESPGAGLAEPLGDGVGAVRAPGTALLLVGETLLATVGLVDGEGEGEAPGATGPLGDAHDDVAVALGGHLGAGDATGVDALHDDVAGLVELLGRDGLPGHGLGLQDDLGAALEVEAELGGLLRVGPVDRPAEQAAQRHQKDQEPRQGSLGVGALGGARHLSGPRTRACPRRGGRSAGCAPRPRPG